MAMQTVTITIELSEEDFREAEELGILTPEAYAKWVQSQLDEWHMEIVNAEIQAYRAEKRAKQAEEAAEE